MQQKYFSIHILNKKYTLKDIITKLSANICEIKKKKKSLAFFSVIKFYYNLVLK